MAKNRDLDWGRMQRLGEVQAELGASLEDMLALVEEVLRPEPYSREEVCQVLGISQEELESSVLSANTQHGEVVCPPPRTIHSIQLEIPGGSRFWETLSSPKHFWSLTTSLAVPIPHHTQIGALIR